MLETQDILFIVLMFCALWFTVFLCWLMYQIGGIMRRVHGFIDLLEKKIEQVEISVGNMKSKMESNFSMFTTVADGLRRLVDIVRRERD